MQMAAFEEKQKEIWFNRILKLKVIMWIERENNGSLIVFSTKKIGNILTPIRFILYCYIVTMK